MSKIRMIAPAEMAGFTLAGIALDVEDGHLDVEPHYVDQLRAHGFTVAGGEYLPLDRAALVRVVADAARSAAELWSDDDLRVVARRTADEHRIAFDALLVPKAAPEPVAAPEPSPEQRAEQDAPDDEFKNLNRAELFAWLKDKGVAVGPATGELTLRKIARETAAKG
jgi:hypothetical protein